ncbi:uncharacterized protein N7469_000592 [Penicillium citrinum]|uniref:Uncharacterized protein n=2 Tax=Penicillium TaxID=5073 RepID=A0A9W9PD86_PENCI|nr:uncharacterized protein N7469_000592 [Penicillium citrinum]KAJ5242265.1 hypothetical protein N7469_000592 [Penicillium citrinum]KAJ5600245.1 hypothetical protein N7450_001312 [Penicillium hetheringtonii]
MPFPTDSVPSVGPQAAAVIGGSFLTGAMACLSGVVIPVFLDTDTDSAHLLRQWVRVYHYGHIYMPTLCVGTFGLYQYTALHKYRKNGDWLLYAVAGATTIAMVPFTWIFMAPTNNVLFGLDKSATTSTLVENFASVQNIVVKWSWLHDFRCIFPFVGVLLGFRGILRELGA